MATTAPAGNDGGYGSRLARACCAGSFGQDDGNDARRPRSAHSAAKEAAGAQCPSSTYSRVFALLGSEKRLGVVVALANIALAGAQFAEPVLFGRIIDALVGAQAAGRVAQPGDLVWLLAAWVAFGLFTIFAGVVLALYADRLAHRRRLAVITGYFEHVIQMPIPYHGTVHSGRLMKVMLQGSDALWGMWLSFFRDHFASFVALVLLLPVAVWMNWRLGSCSCSCLCAVLPIT